MVPKHEIFIQGINLHASLLQVSGALFSYLVTVSNCSGDTTLVIIGNIVASLLSKFFPSTSTNKPHT